MEPIEISFNLYDLSKIVHKVDYIVKNLILEGIPAHKVGNLIKVRHGSLSKDENLILQKVTFTWSPE